MARRIFISFLGAGNYKEINYNNTNLSTEFVQHAIIDEKGKDFFDNIYILTTQTSKEKHWSTLANKLEEYKTEKTNIKNIEFSEDLINDQWLWFESVLSLIKNEDELWFDMTHGYRAFSIVLSTALNFIQKSKNIDLKAVYYGAHDAPNNPIINMVDFYKINEWANAISHLVESANADKLADLSKTATSKSFESLKDKELIDALKELTKIIKNVNVNYIAEKADSALKIIAEKINKCKGADKHLLSMVTEKFSELATGFPNCGKYDKNYFIVQLNLIKMLNKHNFYMQSFTIMREMIGSIAMLGIPQKYANKNMKSNKGKTYRKIFGEIFIQMCFRAEDNWMWEKKLKEAKEIEATEIDATEIDANEIGVNKLEVEKKLSEESELRKFGLLKTFYYEKLKKIGVVEKLREISNPITAFRNGFDHAWLSASKKDKEDLQNVEVKAEKISGTLQEIIDILIKEKIITPSEEK